MQNGVQTSSDVDERIAAIAVEDQVEWLIEILTSRTLTPRRSMRMYACA